MKHLDTKGHTETPNIALTQSLEIENQQREEIIKEKLSMRG